MDFNDSITEQIEAVIKPDSRYCDRECKAKGGGTCIGRAKNFDRPFIVYGEGRSQWMADMSTSDITEIPVDCPFFGRGAERG